jgi:hypothetical protein
MSTASSRIHEPDALHWIRKRASDVEVSRYRLAREICERFDWRDTRGRYQEMACRKRLGELH